MTIRNKKKNPTRVSRMPDGVRCVEMDPKSGAVLICHKDGNTGEWVKVSKERHA